MNRWFTLMTGIIIGSVIAFAALSTSQQASARSIVQTEKVQALMPMEENASAPKLAYQGRLLDAAGQPKADGGYQMLFSLYDVSNGGAPLWSESKSVAVSKGLFSTLLGDTTPLTLAIFDGRDLFLGVTIGSDPETTPRQPITHVAYAIYANSAASATNAANADTLDGQDSTTFANVSHNHDPRYVNSDGPDSIVGNTTGEILYVKQSGNGDGLVGITSATSPGKAGVEGSSGAASGTTMNGGAGVLGDSKDTWGVVGVSLNKDGIIGFSTNGAGVYGQSLNNIGVRAYSQSGNALQVEGKAQVNGDLNVTGNIVNKMAPIALGFINSDGTVNVSSGNISSLWNAASTRYEVTISGQSYLFNTFVTTVTSTCAGYSARTTSVNGKLLVTIHNTAGTAVQCGFQFVTYKP